MYSTDLARHVVTACSVPLRELVGLKSGGCRKLSRGNAEHRRSSCVSYETMRGSLLLLLLLLLLYRCCWTIFCSGAFGIRRECSGDELVLLLLL